MNNKHLELGIKLAKEQSEKRGRVRTIGHFAPPTKVKNIIHYTVIMISSLLAILVGLMIYIQMSLLEIYSWFTTTFAILWITTTLYWYSIGILRNSWGNKV